MFFKQYGTKYACRFLKDRNTHHQWTGGRLACFYMRWWLVSRHSMGMMKMTCSILFLTIRHTIQDGCLKKLGLFWAWYVGKSFHCSRTSFITLAKHFAKSWIFNIIKLAFFVQSIWEGFWKVIMKKVIIS